MRKNQFPQIKITANIFPAKIYSRVNILYLKFATQDITKKSCLSEIVPLSFRNKTVYNELLVFYEIFAIFAIFKRSAKISSRT